MRKRHVDLQTIKNELLDFDSPKRVKFKHKEFKNSAVLFPLIQVNDTFDIILIKRTNVGTKHRGEVSFPGGKFDPNLDKSLQDTALRKTEEEIGVSKEIIKILGCLDDFPTMTRYIITPFVGLIQNRMQMKKQDEEVEEIYRIPIDFFLDRNNFNETYFNIESNKFPVYHYPKYGIWGATAHLIVIFVEKIYKVLHSTSNLKRFPIDQIAALTYPINGKNIVKKNMHLDQ